MTERRPRRAAGPAESLGRRVRAVVPIALLAFPGLAGAAPAGTREAPVPVPRNVQFTHLTGVEGLSQEIVADLAQDPRGYLWIATQEGLNRFDGYEVRVYEQRRGDLRTLPHDFVRVLSVDRQGHLWAGTDGGAARYDVRRDDFDRLPFGPGVPLGDPVRALAHTRDGAHWFGTAGRGLLRVDRNGNTRRFLHDPEDPASLPGDTVLALLEDATGSLWVGTATGGLARWDAIADAFQRYRPAPGPGAEPLGREVRVIRQDRSGLLWIGTGDAGLFRYDRRRGAFEHLSPGTSAKGALRARRVRDVIEDERGTLWVATDAGLAEWRRTEQAFVTYAHQDGDPRSLRSDNATALLVDASGVLWVGTWDGVSRWNYLSDTFTYHDAEDGRLPGEMVTGVAEDDRGDLWVATYGDGLARIDPLDGTSRTWAHDPADPSSLPDDRVMAVHVDGRDRVWVGTRAGGLARLDARTGDGFQRFVHDPRDPRSLSADGITSLLEDGTGALWVGTYGGGLDRLGPDGAGFDRYRHDPTDPGSLSGDRVVSLAVGEGGGLWVGTDGDGLNRLDPATGRVQRFRRFALIPGAAGAPTAADGSGILELEAVMDLLRDPEGALWIGTLGQGLLRWDPEDRRAGRARVRMFGKREGLPTDTIFGLLPGEGGVLWISSNRGLTRFDPGTGSVRQFDVRNGLRDSEFNHGARLRSRSGRLLFGGPRGLVSFHPGDLPFNERVPGLVVTARSRQQVLATTSTGGAAAAVEIDYLDRFLAFDFVALDFTSPDKNQYRYRLEGLEDEWILADGFRRAAYTNLPAGHFTFRVQAANNDGVWTPEGVSVPVTVVPAPWNSAWAYTAYGLVAAGVVGLVFRGQRARLRREALRRAELEREVQARTEELAARNRELESLNDQLSEASVTDSLTGLRNRRYVDQFIATELARFERSQTETALAGAGAGEELLGRTLFFMMIDLDGFKAINDRFGHHAGDLALVQVTEILIRCCRSSDTVVRWGGDEFMVIGVASGIFQAKVLAERIREAVGERPYDLGEGRTGRLSASIGIAPYPFVERRYGFCGWEQVSAIADQAAYLAKANGRNGWVSIAGAEMLRREQLGGIVAGLRDLASDGLLLVDSSFPRELHHPGPAADTDAATPPPRG